MPFLRNTGRIHLPTTMSVSAAIHSYEAMAMPITYPEPDMPTICSAEMFAAISEVPMAHQGRARLARK